MLVTRTASNNFVGKAPPRELKQSHVPDAKALRNIVQYMLLL